MRPIATRKPRLAPTHPSALVALPCFAHGPAALADSVDTKERTGTQVAEGVYVIRHPELRLLT